MKSFNQYQVLQIVLFFILVLFGIALLLGWVTAPSGPSGEWFKQVWTVFLLVLSPQALAAAMSRADGTPGDAPALNPAASSQPPAQDQATTQETH